LSETGFDPADEEALIATHLSRRPDAMLLTGIHHTAQARRILLGAGIPVVEVWDITDSPIDMCAGFSHVGAARAVAKFAAEAGYAHAGSVSANDERALRRGQAFAERYRRLTGADVTAVDLDGPASLVGGRRGLAELIDGRGFERGVIFCSSDLLAHGVIVEAQARGLAIPGQVAVIGFGDQDFAAHTSPSITTVRVDRAALGLAAGQAVLRKLGGEAVSATVFDVGFEILRRESA
jgi:LacI family gluconate utilization system Gnt-I transcriptional repressor